MAEVLLADIDRKLASLIDERRALVARIEACNLAIAGTGVLKAGGGTPIQRLRTRRALPFADPMPAAVAGAQAVSGVQVVPGALVVSGHRLRAAVESLLLATGQPVTLRELERLLRLQGLGLRGRPSQTLANALRPAIAAGTVVRTGRGCYQAA